MKHLLCLAGLVAVLSIADGYSKYGRSCKDIGCPSNQMCVMQEDPCSYYARNNECGKYPTCKRVSNNAATCDSYVCPPTMTCSIDRGVPKCFASNANGNKQTRVPAAPSNYPQQPNRNPTYQYNNQQSGGYPNYPSYPQTGGRTNYPQGAGQTTPKPNVYHPGQRVSGGGYQGGVIGSGYPGQGGYPRQGTGYPGYNAGGGYSNQGNRYPQNGGYPVQYNNGYSNGQGGYSNYGRTPSQTRTQDGSQSLLGGLADFFKTNLNINL